MKKRKNSGNDEEQKKKPKKKPRFENEEEEMAHELSELLDDDHTPKMTTSGRQLRSGRHITSGQRKSSSPPKDELRLEISYLFFYYGDRTIDSREVLIPDIQREFVDLVVERESEEDGWRGAEADGRSNAGESDIDEDDDGFLRETTTMYMTRIQQPVRAVNGLYVDRIVAGTAFPRPVANLVLQFAGIWWGFWDHEDANKYHFPQTLVAAFRTPQREPTLLELGEGESENLMGAYLGVYTSVEEVYDVHGKKGVDTQEVKLPSRADRWNEDLYARFTDFV